MQGREYEDSSREEEKVGIRTGRVKEKQYQMNIGGGERGVGWGMKEQERRVKSH